MELDGGPHLRSELKRATAAVHARLDRRVGASVPGLIGSPSDSGCPRPVSRPSPSLAVRVLLFSTLREGVGAGEVPVDLPEGATGVDLLDRLADAHEAIARHRPVVRLAVNRRYVPLATPLSDGDEVALITPVSGG